MGGEPNIVIPDRYTTPRHIIFAVAKEWDIRPDILTGRRQEAFAVRPRHAAIAIVHRLSRLSLYQLGEHFGRDHTSLINARRKMADHMAALDLVLNDQTPPILWVRALKARLEAMSEPPIWEKIAAIGAAVPDHVWEKATGLPWLEFELPLPPSVNRRVGKLGNKSPEVVAWQGQADMAWLLIKRQQKIPTFFCKVRMEMICGVQSNWDLDNRIKPMQDYLERIEVVKNDRLIRDVRAVDSEGSVPKGRVMVRLRPWVAP
jgi:Holliday junction resolvase RusA-like endonuclease